MSLFKPEHLYGQILELMYNNPGHVFTLKELNEIYTGQAFNLSEELDRLALDRLVVKTPITNNSFSYRISHEGYVFVNSIENTNKTLSTSQWSLKVSLAAIAITILVPMLTLWFQWAVATKSANDTNASGRLPKTTESGHTTAPKDTIQKDTLSP